MDLEKIRDEIDVIDDELIRLFEKRMNLVTEVAEYKKQNDLPVYNHSRERDIVSRLSKKLPDDMSVYTGMLYNTIFEISRFYQSKKIDDTSLTAEKIKTAIENTPKTLPSNVTVACQGVEGAYSQIAAEKIITNPSIIYFNNFKGVFDAVSQGLCRYGILPVENSIYGTVTEVSDLMSEYNFSIVSAKKIQINHVLLAKSGTKEIKEIFSHKQALGQCDKFLKSLKDVKITICENTAMAAKAVAESGRDDVASISSIECGEIYGLDVIKTNIADSDNNYTRFVCISKEFEIYPGADKITVMFKLSHKPGSLYNTISKFAAIGANLTKIESRPIAGRDFEFMFLLDMNMSVYSEDFITLISQLDNSSYDFVFLGAYREQ